jgi:CRISPR-associated protein Cas1
MTPGSALGVEHDAVRVERDGRLVFRAPLRQLSGIVVFGRVSVSPFLIERCASDGRGLVWLDRNGRFRARVQGPVGGNVHLRCAQHDARTDPRHPWRIARQIVAGKVHSSRQVLMRGARETRSQADRTKIGNTTDRLADALSRTREADSIDVLRGIEGEAARAYFETLPVLIRSDRTSFAAGGRSRRPPRDRLNALLSFLYALLRNECVAALEGVGLDPQVGFLHALRPGRPSLALDLMEEFRPMIADRLAVRLINLRQVKVDHFEVLPGGAVALNDAGRRAVIEGYQRRKTEEVNHPLLRERVPIGLIPHVQARLLARHLRDELSDYPPFRYR